MYNTAFFLDFDGTLFDTISFRKSVLPFLEQTGVSVAEWHAAYEAIREGNYSLSKHIAEMNRKRGGQLVPASFEADFYRTFADVKQFVYPDVVPFLERAKREGAQLFLLTWGDSKWQGFKVRASGLAPFFEAIHFTPALGEKGKPLGQECSRRVYGRIIAVDDTKEELDGIKKAQPRAITYLISRQLEKDGKGQIVFDGHHFCASLSEIEAMRV